MIFFSLVILLLAHLHSHLHSHSHSHLHSHLTTMATPSLICRANNCFNPRTPYDRVCTVHLCPANGCSRHRVRDSGREEPACQRHLGSHVATAAPSSICRANNCFNRSRFHGGTICAVHLCPANGCSRYRVGNSGRVWPACQRHLGSAPQRSSNGATGTVNPHCPIEDCRKFRVDSSGEAHLTCKAHADRVPYFLYCVDNISGDKGGCMFNGSFTRCHNHGAPLHR